MQGVKYSELDVSELCKAHGHIYLNNYEQIRIPMAIVCRCGNIGQISLMKIMAGQGCGNCAEYRWRETFEAHGCEVLEYSSARDVTYICSCGNLVEHIQAANWLRGNRDCLKCREFWNANQNKEIRQYMPGQAAWRATALKEADYLCQTCSSPHVLVVHHVFPWAKYVSLRVVQSNADVMCTPCHSEFHATYGYDTNQEMLTQFKEAKCSMTSVN